MAFWNKSRRRAAASPAPRSPRSDPELALRVVRAYHEQTKHALGRYAAGPMDLDWATQPDPFRRYAGAPLLPLVVPGSGAGTDSAPESDPDYGAALVEGRVPAMALDADTLSRLLFDSLAVSAWKQAGDTRWALRVNPSSGNLHPTEAYLLLPRLAGLGDGPAVVHYAPREHALEQRASLPDDLWKALEVPAGGLLVALSSIHWREAWKYGERAFRYCQHDVGHAIAAVAIGAAALGWRTRMVEGVGTRDIGRLVGLPEPDGPEAEHPDCLLVLAPDGDVPQPMPGPAPELLARFDALTWSGVPNDLSPAHEEWDAIELTAEATYMPPEAPPHARWARPGTAEPVEAGANGLREIVRRRRSGLAFDGRTGMPAATFFRILESCMPRAGRVPFTALPWSPRLHLAVFVHRVEGLHQGLYWLQRDPASFEAVRSACREEFLWLPAEGCPDGLPLSLVLPMDLRGQAAQISCGQAIAGDGAFSLGMVAEFDRSLDEHGAWFYPRLFWEAGAIGQVLYLEAEAVGLRSTGIGCYLDDPMHSILGLKSRALQSLYHFTVGQHVEDARLTSRPAYPPPEDEAG